MALSMYLPLLPPGRSRHALQSPIILDNENEKKEACSCPEGISSPASQSNPYDRGDGDGDVDEGENANEESAQSEAAGNDDDGDDGASSDFESIKDVSKTKLIWSAFAWIVTRERGSEGGNAC